MKGRKRELIERQQGKVIYPKFPSVGFKIKFSVGLNFL